MSGERWLTPTDVRLLGSLARTPNLVRAARAIGIERDRAVYRLQRLSRLYGRAVAVGRRGGVTPGATRLTALGRRLLERAGGPSTSAQHWVGSFHVGPPPRVVVGPGRELVVSFRASDGQRVAVDVDPEAFVVARRRAELSARNVLRARARPGRPPAARDGRARSGLGRHAGARRAHLGVGRAPAAHPGGPGLPVRQGGRRAAGERTPDGLYSRIPSVVSEKTASPSGRLGESIRRAIRRGGFDLRR